MKDKIVLLMKETGCEQGEAELALEMCGYDVEQAVRAVPRLFHNIVVLKGKAVVPEETFYVLFLVFLNLKGRTLLRARAVASYNPAAVAISFDRDWFDIEKHLYACRLRGGAVQALSQELEQILAAYFASPEARRFYAETHGEVRGRSYQSMLGLLSRRFAPREVQLQLYREVLDMGQFQEMGGRAEFPRSSGGRGNAARMPQAPGSLVLRVALDGSSDGVPARELRAGDFVYAHVNDSRDVARYLAKLFVAQLGDETSLLVPVEAVESGERDHQVCVRVRFSLGVCGDVYLPSDIRIRAVRKTESASWWKKLFGA